MSTKTLTGTYVSGYLMHAPVYTVSIAAGGYVEGVGISDGQNNSTLPKVINSGRVKGSVTGIDFLYGGSVTNGDTAATTASIVGATTGIEIVGGAAKVSNFGTVTGMGTLAGAAGVYLAAGVYAGAIGARLTNGAENDTTALIQGHDGVEVMNGLGTVTNFGTIGDDFGAVIGVYVQSGVLTNGSLLDTQALIVAEDYGVEFAGMSATVENFGSISGGQTGVELKDGGVVTNGDAGDVHALIQGVEGVFALAGTTAGTVINFGTIAGTGGSKGEPPGVYLGAGGVVTNGGTLDITAAITGFNAVEIKGAAGTVTNFGTIGSIQQGVLLADGGLVTNGGMSDTQALIQGVSGVEIGGSTASTISNFGVIDDAATFGVVFNAGRLTNGAGGDATALIESLQVGVKAYDLATVANFGTITGGYTNFRDVGVYVQSGALTNGSLLDTQALISGYRGVDFAASSAAIQNYGTIIGSLGPDDYGVYLANGGMVTNGAAADTQALITAGNAVYSKRAAATIRNFGTIAGAAYLHGVDLAVGGKVTNGSATDFAATISGGIGIDAGAATIQNFGSIVGASTLFSIGVDLRGGALTNGSTTDTGARISGYYGVGGSAATIANFGTIAANSGRTSIGVSMEDGELTNGTAHDTGALISGYRGVRALGALGAATIQNFGTIMGSSGTFSLAIGIYLGGGGRLTNGSAADSTAMISGGTGVEAGGYATTIQNFGTIAGQGGGAAVSFTSTNSTLVVEAGSVFIGAVSGNGGVLDLASGTGTISRMLAGTLVAGVAPSTTTFGNFGTVELGAGAKFTLSGDGGAIGPGGITTLDIAGTLTVTSMLSSSGIISGSGSLAVAGGSVVFDAGNTLTVAKVAVTGKAKIGFIAPSLTYAGLWSQAAGIPLTVVHNAAVDFTGKGNSFGGTLTGGGVITFAGGSDTLNAVDIVKLTTVAIGASATVTLSGAIVLAGTISAESCDLIVAAGGATLSGGGILELSEQPDLPATFVKGATAAATLTNVNDVIDGAAHLGDGQMTLINDAAGVIIGDGAYDLVIDTGANTIVNAGVIEAGGASGVDIVSAVNNTGTLVADSDLTVTGTVTGAGTVQIGAGLADFTKVFTENVTFTGSGDGTLELAHSHAYTGQIAGFSTTGTTTLDLDDISFIGGTTKATYSGTTTSGVLTVTDGTHVARITLEGDYTTSTFTVSAAAGGGTAVVDPTPAQAQAPHQLISAMAAMGASGGLAVRAPDELAVRAPMIAMPHAMLA